ncbi:MAG TPA: DUF2958 domain-containing protein [Methanotrichaceae archaeon]|nr:DUF2958 domain-containing protein [Methanotrichaceae archaeon]
MKNLPNDLELGSFPGLHETMEIPFPEKEVLMHFIMDSGEWFAGEYDPNERLFYGYADLRPGRPEWRCFSLDELSGLRTSILNLGVERDVCWMPKKVKEIPIISGGE